MCDGLDWGLRKFVKIIIPPVIFFSLRILLEMHLDCHFSIYFSLQDLPSFVQNVRQFSNDLRYFLILNQSVPAGSVKLS